MFAYSPKKNNINAAEEYSVKKPATKVDSSSGKSKGNLLVSARAEIKKIMKDIEFDTRLSRHKWTLILIISFYFNILTHSTRINRNFFILSQLSG